MVDEVFAPTKSVPCAAGMGECALRLLRKRLKGRKRYPFAAMPQNIILVSLFPNPFFYDILYLYEYT